MSKKKKAIPKAIKALVWNTHIGESNGIGMCQCCFNTQIKQMSFQCGHIISEHNGGGITINNLKPICSGCNFSMGTRNMDEYMTTHGLGKNIAKDNKTPIKITITDDGDIIDESKKEIKTSNDAKFVEPKNDTKIVEPKNDVKVTKPKNNTKVTKQKNNTKVTKSKNNEKVTNPKNNEKVTKPKNDEKVIKPKNDEKVVKPNNDNQTTVTQNNHIQQRMYEINKQTLDLPNQKEIAQNQLKEMIMSKQNDVYNNQKNNTKPTQITIVDSDSSSYSTTSDSDISSDSESFDDLEFLKDYKKHINKLSNKSRKLTIDEIKHNDNMELIYKDIKRKFHIFSPYNSIDHSYLRSNKFYIDSKNIEIDDLIQKIKDHNDPNNPTNILKKWENQLTINKYKY